MANTPAPNRRWLRFSLAGLLAIVAAAAISIHWITCILRANAATAKAGEAMEAYSAQAVVAADVLLASQEALEADLSVPLRSHRGAYESHLRRLAQMRYRVESEYPATGSVRPIVEFTSHYELALRNLAKVAGEQYAKKVDSEFQFRYRDQFEGHPAAERSL
ncbi:MAG: hypothetical protein WD845_14380 [Pirellulales bacterium]